MTSLVLLCAFLLLTQLWPTIPLGTRSLLVGAHQFLLHPLCVALAWTKLYGVPRDPRLWLTFIVHDWGYWGKHDMDGPDGITHPELGARLVGRWFGPAWYALAAGHSRSFAAREGITVSALCAPDKLATTLVPHRLYLAMVRLSGELPGYMALNRATGGFTGSDPRVWHDHLRREFTAWVATHTQTVGRASHPASRS